MMKRTHNKRSWLRKIIGGLSLTSAMFIFQACYGTPQDFGSDILVQGQVISNTSELPIEGIKVTVLDNGQYEYTDESGFFAFYTEIMDKMKIYFEDVDSIQNGQYVNKDTILYNVSEGVFLDINLDEK